MHQQCSKAGGYNTDALLTLQEQGFLTVALSTSKNWQEGCRLGFLAALMDPEAEVRESFSTVMSPPTDFRSCCLKSSSLNAISPRSHWVWPQLWII